MEQLSSALPPRLKLKLFHFPNFPPTFAQSCSHLYHHRSRRSHCNPGLVLNLILGEDVLCVSIKDNLENLYFQPGSPCLAGGGHTRWAPPSNNRKISQFFLQKIFFKHILFFQEQLKRHLKHQQKIF